MGAIAGLAVGLTLLLINSDESVGQKISFDKDFKFGAASASYQIEGGWDMDYKRCASYQIEFKVKLKKNLTINALIKVPTFGTI